MKKGAEKGNTVSVIALQQAAVAVTNLEASVAFYSDLLGLDYLGHQYLPPETVYELYGLQGVSVRYGWFKVGATASVICLYEFDPVNKTPYTFKPGRLGPLHFSLQVRDLTTLYNDLMAKGVEGVAPPKGRAIGMRSAFIKDPDGLLIELVDLGRHINPAIRIFGGVLDYINRLRRRSIPAPVNGACREKP